MAKKKVLSYDDKSYANSKHIYDVIAQIFDDLKNENNTYGWNKLVCNLEGMTMKFIGENSLQFTHHRYENGTIDDISRLDKNEKFIKEIMTDIKKRFKKQTKLNIELKKIRDDRQIEKVSNHTAETSSMWGGKAYGNSLVGKFLVRDMCVYLYEIE